MKSITATLVTIVAAIFTLKGVAAAALPESQTVTFSDGDSIHYVSKRGDAHVAAQNFVKRHPKDIGIVAKAEDIEDCAAPCDFYIKSVDEPGPAKREVELVKESEDLEDCAAPCDFYIRSEESGDMHSHVALSQVEPAGGPSLPEKHDAELVKESEETEDCAAPCDFYIRSVDEDDAVEDDLAKPWLAKKSDDTADEEDVVEDDLAKLWLAKKSDDTADEEDCAAPCDFYIT